MQSPRPEDQRAGLPGRGGRGHTRRGPVQERRREEDQARPERVEENDADEVVMDEPVFLRAKPIKLAWTSGLTFTKEKFETQFEQFHSHMENEYLGRFITGVVNVPPVNAQNARLSYNFEATAAWTALLACANTNFSFVMKAQRDKPYNERVYRAIEALMYINRVGTDSSSKTNINKVETYLSSKTKFEERWHEMKMKDDSPAEVKRVTEELQDIQRGFAILHSKNPTRTSPKTNDDLKLALERAIVVSGKLRDLAYNCVNNDAMTFEKMAFDILYRAEPLEKDANRTTDAAEKTATTTQTALYSRGDRGGRGRGGNRRGGRGGRGHREYRNNNNQNYYQTTYQNNNNNNGGRG